MSTSQSSASPGGREILLRAAATEGSDARDVLTAIVPPVTRTTGVEIMAALDPAGAWRALRQPVPGRQFASQFRTR